MLCIVNAQPLKQLLSGTSGLKTSFGSWEIRYCNILLNVAIRAFKVYGFDAKMSLLGRQPLGCVRKYNYQTVPNRVVYALKNRNNLNNILYVLNTVIKWNIMKPFKIKI